MLRSPLSWLVFGAVLVAGALAWLTLTRGAAPMGTSSSIEHHALASFHEVEVCGIAEVLLAQGDTEAIDVDAAPHTIVDATVTNGRLVIHARDRGRWWSRLLGHRGAEAPTITLHFRTPRQARPHRQRQRVRAPADDAGVAHWRVGRRHADDR